MTGIGHRLLGLCLPPVVLCTFDAGVTLFCQSAVYWGGEYVRASEGSPTPNHLLQIHPTAFAMGILLWQLLFVTIILVLPDVFALMVSITITFGHAWGASSWLYLRFPYGYQCAMGLLLATAVILGSGIYWGWRARPAETPSMSAWAAAVRWMLVAVAAGIAVYLFLWPRMP